MKNYATFNLWAAAQLPKQRRIIRALRKLIKAKAPSLTETVKWTNGCWVGAEWPVAFLHAEYDRLQFGFFSGSALKDPRGLLQGKGKYIRHTKIYSLTDINEIALTALIRQAVKIEREG